MHEETKMNLSSVTMKMTIQDFPEVTLLLSRDQVSILTQAVSDVDPARVNGSAELSDLQKSFNRLLAILPKALIYHHSTRDNTNPGNYQGIA
jgi:hypothetical protein